MPEWEYQRVSSSIAERMESQHQQAAEKIHDDWINLLNERGAEGWELVTEHFTSRKDPSSGIFFASYGGTVKRPRQ
jgi:hypothetical protein